MQGIITLNQPIHTHGGPRSVLFARDWTLGDAAIIAKAPDGKALAFIPVDLFVGMVACSQAPPGVWDVDLGAQAPTPKRWPW